MHTGHQYSLSLSAYFDFTAGDSRSDHRVTLVSRCLGSLWIVRRYSKVKPDIQTPLNNHRNRWNWRVEAERVSGIDITDRRKSEPLDKEPLSADFAPFWRRGFNGLKGGGYVRVTVWTWFYESLAGVYVLAYTYTYIFVYVWIHVRKTEKEQKAFERYYLETKPSSQHCLGQTKQINRQPLLLLTSRPLILFRSCSLVRSSFAPLSHPDPADQPPSGIY